MRATALHIKSASAHATPVMTHRVKRELITKHVLPTLRIHQTFRCFSLKVTVMFTSMNYRIKTMREKEGKESVCLLLRFLDPSQQQSMHRETLENKSVE